MRTIKLESELDGKTVDFEARGSTLTFAGWKDIFKEDSALADEENEEESENDIPVIEIGKEIIAIEGKMLTKKTQAPTRLTLAGLVRELEKRGIGRPATYASILDNIMAKEYIKEEKRKLVATPLGEKLIDSMQGHFQFLDFDFTKNMEKALDDIAEGKSDYLTVVSQNYKMLQEEIEKFKQARAIPCPKCKSFNLAHRVKQATAKEKGYDFFVCDDCKETFKTENGRPVERQEIPLTDFECEKCQAKLKHLQGNNANGSYDFFICSNDDCKTKYKNENGQPVARKEPALTDFECEKCKAKLKHLHGTSAKGDYDFFVCSNENCLSNYDNIEGKPVKAVPKNTGKTTKFKCKKCKKALIEKPTKTGGVWFSCSGYPDCTEKYWSDENGKPKFD